MAVGLAILIWFFGVAVYLYFDHVFTRRKEKRDEDLDRAYKARDEAFQQMLVDQKQAYLRRAQAASEIAYLDDLMRWKGQEEFLRQCGGFTHWEVWTDEVEINNFNGNTYDGEVVQEEVEYYFSSPRFGRRIYDGEVVAKDGVKRVGKEE